MGKNYKKYLHRMVVASLCAVVLCLAVMVSATLAYFEVSVTNEGNVFEVAQFGATSTVESNQNTVPNQDAPGAMPNQDAPGAMPDQDTPGLEHPVTHPNESNVEVCPEGEYNLRVTWGGNTAGYIKIMIGFAAEEKKDIPTTDYVINLPAFDAEKAYDLQIPLTLYEDAIITTESSWGVYEAAEGESTKVLSLDNIAKFIEDGGITYGTPFEASVTLGSDAIGEDAETAVVYESGNYMLTIEWTPGFAGYCVLDLRSAEESNAADPVEYMIRLPKGTAAEGSEKVVMNIPLCLYEKTQITAVTGKGTPDNSVEWQENAAISYGTQFIASAGIGKVNTEYSALSQEPYEPGTYLLKLDWALANADGYCKITVTSAVEGSETEQAVYVLACGLKDGQNETSCVIELTLHETATIKVETGKGSYTGTAPTVPVEGIVFGTEKTEEDESSNESSTENQNNTGTDGDQNQNGDSVPDPTSSDETVDEPAEGGQQPGDEPGAGNE